MGLKEKTCLTVIRMKQKFIYGFAMTNKLNHGKYALQYRSIKG